MWGFTELENRKQLPSQISIAAPEIQPLVYIDTNGKVKGQFITMFKQFSEKTGISVDIKVMPWRRAVQQTKLANSNALMPALYTKERATFLVYPTEPLVVFSGSVVLQHRHDMRKITSWDDIKGAQIAKVRSMNLGENVEALFTDEKNQLIEVVRVIDGLKMLQHQRVDYVVMDALIASSLIEELSLENTLKVIIHPDEARLINSYLAFSQSFAEKHDIDALMRLINQENVPEKYINKLAVYAH